MASSRSGESFTWSKTHFSLLSSILAVLLQ